MYPKIQRKQVIMNVLHPGCARPAVEKNISTMTSLRKHAETVLISLLSI